MNIRLLFLLLILSSQVVANELPSWGLTEAQYKMPNFTTKMKEIGNKAVDNDWLLKITAPKDWHNKIRAALSQQGAKNVQINFKDSLYKSVTITATPGMALKSNNSQNKQPGVVKKQVVIEKPDMNTEIEAPEFNHDFKADDILSDIGEIELVLPTNGKIEKNANQAKKESDNQTGVAENGASTNKMASQTAQENNQSNHKQTVKENLRMRHARGKTVDKSISYGHITDEDDLFVAEDVVLVKRYINRGVAVYYWMAEDYDPVKHQLTEIGSGKYVKSSGDVNNAAESNPRNDGSQNPISKTLNAAKDVFDFVAVTDDQNVKDQLRRDFIRNKTVNNTLKAAQLKSKDILYVSQHTVLVERPLGNSRSAYFWLEGDTDIQHSIEHMGPQKFVIQ